MAGLVYLGAIQCLQEKGITAFIKHVRGTSSGAFMGLIYCLRLPIEDVCSYLADFLTREDVSRLPPIRLIGLLKNGGLDLGDRMSEPIDFLLRKAHMDPEITFFEFARATGMDLVICATNLASGQPAYFSVDTTPNVAVKKAVIASMTIPGLLPPVRIGDEWFVDGVLCNNIPVPDNVQPLHVLVLIVTAFDRMPIGSMPPSLLHIFEASLRAWLNTMCSPIMYRQYKGTAVSFASTPISSLPLRYLQDGSLHLGVKKELVHESRLVGFRVLSEWLSTNHVYIKPSSTSQS